MKIPLIIYISYICIKKNIWLKKCFYCSSDAIVKNGHKNHIHRYLCKSCVKSFINRKIVDTEALWQNYVFGKQTIFQLSERYGISQSTVGCKLDSVRVPRIISSSKNVVILMDTTYWGRKFGVVVFKDYRTKRILWHKFVRYETLSDYQEGIQWLENHHFKIDGIVCDGLRGIFQLSSKYNVQMCQYHQIRTVQRYLTLNPELPASIELLSIIHSLTHTNK
jgi:hypothetical protein